MVPSRLRPSGEDDHPETAFQWYPGHPDLEMVNHLTLEQTRRRTGRLRAIEAIRQGQWAQVKIKLRPQPLQDQYRLQLLARRGLVALESAIQRSALHTRPMGHLSQRKKDVQSVGGNIFTGHLKPRHVLLTAPVLHNPADYVT